ncbi:MAG: hypothetical protein LAP13_07030 [Acidobacteriia bacterium]|nr:hypothetical protein [Terriglobia bacterium]
MSERETGTSRNVPLKQTPNDGNSPQIALPCSDNIEVPIAHAPKRELGQATLSTISEVSVAAEETLSRAKTPARASRWLAVLSFFLLVYIASSSLAIYALKSAPWVRVFLAPLAPVFLATLAFALSRRWKSRARDLSSDRQGWRNAAGSLGHEAANGVNAIRANLIAFRLANSQVEGPEHLEEIEQACARLDAALEKSKHSSGH